MVEVERRHQHQVTLRERPGQPEKRGGLLDKQRTDQEQNHPEGDGRPVERTHPQAEVLLCPDIARALLDLAVREDHQ